MFELRRLFPSEIELHVSWLLAVAGGPHNYRSEHWYDKKTNWLLKEGNSDLPVADDEVPLEVSFVPSEVWKIFRPFPPGCPLPPRRAA